MRRIEVTYSTMGQSNPATVAEGAGSYRYRGDPDWTPGDPRYREQARSGKPDGGPGSAGRKQKRVDDFAAALREQGYDPWTAPKAAVIKAGRQVGVGEDTARGYRNELKLRSLQDGEMHDD